MKLFFLAFFCSLSSILYAQKVMDLPEKTGDVSGGFYTFVTNGSGAGKKYNVGNFVNTNSNYSNPSWLTALHPNKLLQGGAITGQILVWSGTSWVPTTISSGGGGTWGSITGTLSSQTDLQSALDGKSSTSHTHTFSSLTSKPTTLSGYGITDNVTTQGNTFNGVNQLVQLNGAGALPAIDGGLLTGLTKSQVGLANVPNVDATNATNITSGTLPDARLSSNVPLLSSNNNFRYVGTAPLSGGTFFGQKTSNYVTGGLNYNSGSHILVANHFMDTLRFNGHNQTAYGVRISPTFVNSGAYSETDRRALVVDGNTLINGNLQLTGTLTFPGVLSASSFDATTSFRLNGTNVVNTYWSNGMLSIGFPVTGTIIQNTSNGNHILYANNASNSIAIGQGTGYPTAAPANGLGVVGSVGAGTLSPNSTLSTAGSFSTAFSSKTTTYTATASDFTITADATSAAFSITLPTAVGISGRMYVIKKTDASGNAVTVATTSTQTIDGSTTYSLSTQYKYVTVQSTGANWIIIGNN